MRSLKSIIIICILALLVACEEEEKLMKDAEIVEKVSECEVKVAHQDNTFKLRSGQFRCDDVKAMELGNTVDIYYVESYRIKRIEH